MATTKQRAASWSGSFHDTTKRLPGEVPWEPPYQYECSAGHSIRASRATSCCPAAVLGERCSGELRRVGPGAGRGSHR